MRCGLTTQIYLQLLCLRLATWALTLRTFKVCYRLLIVTWRSILYMVILIWVKDLNGLSSCFLYLSCVASWEVEDTKYGGKGRGIGWSLESSGKSVWCWKTTILLQCQGNWASQSEHSGFIAETDTFKTNYIIAALLKWFMDIRMLLSGIATTYYSIIDGTPNDVILCQQSESMWIKVKKKNLTQYLL